MLIQNFGIARGNYTNAKSKHFPYSKLCTQFSHVAVLKAWDFYLKNLVIKVLSYFEHKMYIKEVCDITYRLPIISANNVCKELS